MRRGRRADAGHARSPDRRLRTARRPTAEETRLRARLPNVVGLQSSRRGDGLPRRLSARRCDRRPAPSRPSAASSIPPVDNLISGFQAGAKDTNPDVKTAQRLLAGLRRPGEVQGDRPRPDRPGLRRRLPGGRQAAASARSTPRGEGHLGIGVDADQSFAGEHVLTSALKPLQVRPCTRRSSRCGRRARRAAASRSSASRTTRTPRLLAPFTGRPAVTSRTPSRRSRR